MNLAQLLQDSLAPASPATKRIDMLPIFGRVLRGVLKIMRIEGIVK